MLLPLIVACTWIPDRALDLDEDGVLDTVDCDRDDPEAGELQTWFRDEDQDGFGLPDVTKEECGDPGEGWVLSVPVADCDDTDPLGSVAQPFFQDADGDGFGSSTDLVLGCGRPEGASEQGGDCDDTDPEVSPGAAEVCNTIDDDCDGRIDDEDEVFGAPRWYADADADGVPGTDSLRACIQPADRFPPPSSGVFDCDDSDPARSPATPEQCANQIDEDCSGTADDDPAQATSWWTDGDGDGFAPAGAVETLSCAVPADTTPLDPITATDCDDGDAEAFPGAVEVYYDGTDGDCLGDEDYDVDGDGYVPTPLPPGSVPYAGTLPTGDCDDADAALSPAAAEICGTGVDEDCDGLVDDSGVGGTGLARDADGDGAGTSERADRCDASEPGWVVPGGPEDCDDADASVFPGAVEVAGDGIDQDCSGSDTAICFLDVDGDGFGDPDAPSPQADGTCDAGESALATDCDDTDGEVFPGQVEWCDDIDHDCDGSIDPGVDRATEWAAGVPTDVTATLQTDAPYTPLGDRLELCNGSWSASLTVGSGQTVGSPDGLPKAVLVAGAAEPVVLDVQGGAVRDVIIHTGAGANPAVNLTGGTVSGLELPDCARDGGVGMSGGTLSDTVVSGAAGTGVGVALLEGANVIDGLTVSNVEQGVYITTFFGGAPLTSIEIDGVDVSATTLGLVSTLLPAGLPLSVTDGRFDALTSSLSCEAGCTITLTDVQFENHGIAVTNSLVDLLGVEFLGGNGIQVSQGQLFGEDLTAVGTEGFIQAQSSLVVIDGAIVDSPTGASPVLGLSDAGGFINGLSVTDAILTDTPVIELIGTDIDFTNSSFDSVQTGAVAPIELSAFSDIVFYAGGFTGGVSDTAGVVHAVNSTYSALDFVLSANTGTISDVWWLEGSQAQHGQMTAAWLDAGASVAPEVHLDAGGEFAGGFADFASPLDVVFSDDTTETVAAMGVPPASDDQWLVFCPELLGPCTVTSGIGCATVRGGRSVSTLLLLLFAVCARRRYTG